MSSVRIQTDVVNGLRQSIYYGVVVLLTEAFRSIDQDSYCCIGLLFFHRTVCAACFSALIAVWDVLSKRILSVNCKWKLKTVICDSYHPHTK